MANIFILWSSTEGQTRRIVQVMEQELRKGGHRLETINADAPPRGWIVSKADAVLVAASVHRGQYSAGLRKQLKLQSARLSKLPSLFITVCLSAARPETEQEAEGYAAKLLAEIGWQPTRSACLGGALRYPEYPLLKRWMMKRIAKQQGLPTDTSKVHEFTDWERVRSLAAEMAELARASELQHA